MEDKNYDIYVSTVGDALLEFLQHKFNYGTIYL